MPKLEFEVEEDPERKASERLGHYGIFTEICGLPGTTGTVLDWSFFIRIGLW